MEKPVSLLIIATLFLILQKNSISGSQVEFLPGFNGGPLPFELETGYIGVDEREDVQLFYYFVKSEGDFRRDPLMLWLTGGPGCSSLTGLAFEIGPLYFESKEYNGSLPSLILNPNSWTKETSIIFVDLPVGTGFSYARTSKASQSTDMQMFDQAYEFLRKWLVNHPGFILNPFYVGGDSYSGIPVPVISQLISNGNEAGIEPFINLKGYILGNPLAFPNEDNYGIPFAHGMGLISEELYQSLKKNCRGEYMNVDPSNSKCLRDVHAFDQCISGVNKAHILERYCGLASKKPWELIGERRSLHENLHEEFHENSAYYCRIDGYRLSKYWSNDKSVQEALHVRKGTIKEWVRCNDDLPFVYQLLDSVAYHANLSAKGYRSLIYSGDHDMFVPHQSTEAWIKYLNYSITHEWRSWIVNDQVAGYTRTYSNHMTFATVKGGGHTAPEYRPEECAAMFKRWISHQPL